MDEKKCAMCGLLFRRRARCGFEMFEKQLFCSPSCKYAFSTRPEEDRFWEKVYKTEGCWIWNAGTTKFGYGVFCVKRNGMRQMLLAHRYSFSLVNRDIADGICICHSCDNPPCVRPSHLFPGTQYDNLLDMTNKGRRNSSHEQKGVLNHNSKLSEDDILKIKSLYPQMSQQKIADIFGVCQAHISSILSGRRWGHETTKET